MPDFANSPLPGPAQPTNILASLSRIPGHIWAECVDSVRESREAIAHSVRSAMDEQQISTYLLAEKSGVSPELIELILDGAYDLCDSLPISQLEKALSIRLNHL